MKILFDKTRLPEEVKSVLQSKRNVYAQTTALTQFVESARQTGIDTLLCLANLEMGCSKSTGFEEDTIDFGNNAVNWLNQALAIEPENEAVKRYISFVRKKIKRAEKSANEILAYETEDFNEMPDISYVKELAFYYYSRYKKSTVFAEKGYAAYAYVYNREKAINPDSPELLYYWHALTICMFEARGYGNAKAEIEQLINWNLTPEQSSYRENITDGYWIKLFHFSQVDDIESFRKLYAEWHTRMVPPGKSEAPYIALFDLLNPISNWLLQQEGTNEYLAYILENGYNFFSKRILSDAHLETMIRIRKYLK